MESKWNTYLNTERIFHRTLIPEGEDDILHLNSKRSQHLGKLLAFCKLTGKMEEGIFSKTFVFTFSLERCQPF